MKTPIAPKKPTKSDYPPQEMSWKEDYVLTDDNRVIKFIPVSKFKTSRDFYQYINDNDLNCINNITSNLIISIRNLLNCDFAINIEDGLSIKYKVKN